MSRVSQNRFRDWVKYRAGALCLIGILTATYMHTTSFMSQFFYDNLILGGIAALAIDAGVVAMAIFKDELIKTGELAWMVRVVTVIVLFASGVANMSEGFRSAYGITLTTDTMMALDLLTWIQWIAGTIVFPIMAYVMCDTIGTRNLQALYQSMGEELPEERPALRSAGPPRNSTRKLQAGKARSREGRIQALIRYRNQNPDATNKDMMDAIGIESRTTLASYLEEIEDRSFASNGFSSNGHS